MAFKKATKFESKARLALVGPAKAGKSLTALLVASGLGPRIAAIDTEHGALSKYADRVDFDVMELKSFHPKEYIAAMREAEREGYDALVVDSGTHAWSSKGGVLRQVDEATQNSKSKDSFGAWREPRKVQDDFVEALHESKLHVCMTLRAKMAYELQKNDRTGKLEPVKLGLEPIQDKDFEYEFDFVGMLDRDHIMTIEGSRLAGFGHTVTEKPGKEFGERVLAALSGVVRKEPWETVEFLLGELTGTLVGEASEGTIGRYVLAVREHIKRHPDFSRADRDTWIAHGVLCAQAQEAAKKRPEPPPSTEKPADDDNLPH